MMRTFIVEGWFLLLMGLALIATTTALIWTMYENKQLRNEIYYKRLTDSYVRHKQITESGFIGGLLLLILGIAAAVIGLIFYGLSQLW